MSSDYKSEMYAIFENSGYRISQTIKNFVMLKSFISTIFNTGS